MRQISIAEFRASVSKEMKELPFEVTKNGKVIAVMTAPGVEEVVEVEKPEPGRAGGSAGDRIRAKLKAKGEYVEAPAQGTTSGKVAELKNEVFGLSKSDQAGGQRLKGGKSGS